MLKKFRNFHSMDLQAFPVELQYSIIDYLAGDDILNLSLTNKYFFAFLSPFQKLSSIMAVGLLGEIWPTIDLENWNVREDKLKNFGFNECRFKFQSISISASVLNTLENLPPSKELIISMDSKTDPECLATVFKQDVTDLEIGKLFDVDFDLWKAIPTLTKLKTLRMGYDTKIDWKFLVGLIPKTKVEILAVESAIFTPDSLYLFENLARLNLKELHLSRSSFMNIHIEKLAKSLPFTSIKYLELRDCSIGDHGAKTISKVLRDTQLHYLGLENNRITSEGLEHLSEGIMNSKLKRLEINLNDFDDDDWYLLYRKLPYTCLESLEVGLIGEMSQLALASTLSKSKVTKLAIMYCSDYHNNLTQAIKDSKLKTLEIVDEASEDGDPSILGNLAKYLPCEALYIEQVGPSSILTIFQNLKQSKVKKFGVWDTPLNEIMPFVAKEICKTNLVTLSFQIGFLTDESILYLADGLNAGKLRNLDLSSNPEITVDGILQFVDKVKNSSLQQLAFRDIFKSRKDKEMAMSKVRRILEHNYRLYVSF